MVISHLAQKFFDRGEDAYVTIEPENEASISLHKNLGFKIYGDQVAWIVNITDIDSLPVNKDVHSM